MKSKEQLYRRSSFLKKIVKEAANQAAIEKSIAEVKRLKDELNKFNINDGAKAISEIFMTTLTSFDEIQKEVKRNITHLKKLDAPVDITLAIHGYAGYVAAVFVLLASIECGKMILQKKEFSSKISYKALDAVNDATQKLVNLYKQIAEAGNKIKSVLKDRITEIQQAKTVSPEAVKKLTDAINEFMRDAEKINRYRQDVADKAARTVVQQLQKKYPR